MAQIDASIPLSGQGFRAPDALGSAAKAYTLKEAQMAVQQSEQAQSERTQLKALFAENPNPDAAAVMRISPEQGLVYQKNKMELEKSGAELAKAKAETDKISLETQAKSADILAGAAMAVDSRYKELAQKLPPEQAKALANVEWHKQLSALQQQGVIKPDQVAHFGDFEPQGFYQFLPRLLGAKATLEQKVKDRELAQKDTEIVIRQQEANTSAKREQAYEKSVGSGFTPQMGELMGALAERGVSLPAGFRSKSQQVQMLQGLLERNSDLSPDEIAEKIKDGQIDFGAEKKKTQIAAGVAGKNEVFENEIKLGSKVLLEASAAVPRGSFVPINKLMQMGESSISDPNLKKLKVYVTSMLNAYDALAARGGTDKAKREHAHELLLSADGPEALQAAVEAFNTEADIAMQSAAAAMKSNSKPLGDSGKSGPKAGDVEDGYRFKGGNPSDPASWEKQ